MDLPRRLRILRIRAGHTQRSLSDALDVHYTAISHIEQGKRNPSLALLEKWAGACGAGITIATKVEIGLLDALLIEHADPELLARLAQLIPHLDPAHRTSLEALISAWEKSAMAGLNQERKTSKGKIGQ